MRRSGTPLKGQMSIQASVGASLTELVAERLGDYITENHMAPGDMLPSEESLSQSFVVSKRVIREALRSLSAQGIVHTSQGKRAVVTEATPLAMEAYFRYMHRLDRASILELYELREIIEVRATVIAAKRATPSELARAQQALELMESARSDFDAYVAGDLGFHMAVMDAAHNRFLSAVMAALWERSGRSERWASAIA